jgi:hypothetical protein
MILRDTTVSIEVEIDAGMAGAIDGDPAVTASYTGDHGPNGQPMYKITGKVPAVLNWLSESYGCLADDVLQYIPELRLENLIP